jgi:hypothetical protein
VPARSRTWPVGCGQGNNARLSLAANASKQRREWAVFLGEWSSRSLRNRLSRQTASTTIVAKENGLRECSIDGIMVSQSIPFPVLRFALYSDGTRWSDLETANNVVENCISDTCTCAIPFPPAKEVHRPAPRGARRRLAAQGSPRKFGGGKGHWLGVVSVDI